MDDSSHSPEAANKKHHFILFISGMSQKSVHAVENMRRICDAHFSGEFELEIIDINRDRQSAVSHQIIAIPTLIKLNPAPKRTILGDLSDMEKVLKILDIE